MAAPQNLGQALVQIGLLDIEQLTRLSKSAARTGRRLSQEVVAAGIVTEDRLVAELSGFLGMDVVDPARTPIHERVLNIIPAEVAHRHRIVPLARRKDGTAESLFVVTADPFDDDASNAVAGLLPDGVSIQRVLAGEREISTALEEHYGPNPRPDTVSAPAPTGSWEDSGGIRMGGSAAIPLSNSILPDEALSDAVTTAATPVVAASAAPVVETKVPANGAPRMPSQADSSATDASEQLGAYRLTERIGVSGMAETWDAIDTGAAVPDTHVRVRRMLPSLSKNERSRAKFFGAAQRMVGVDHENLIVVVDAGSQSGHHYVVTEPFEGHDLDRVLAAAAAKKMRFPAPLALLTMQGILRGLQAAHDAMVFHEQLSPRTVFITKDGAVKVADFGVAPTLLEEHGRYVAPEQNQASEADHRADVFRAGLILFELLMSEPLVDAAIKEPDRANEAVRGFRRRFSERRPNDTELEKLLAGALHAVPDRRYESAEAFLVEVEKHLERAGTTASDPLLMRFVEDVLRPDPFAADSNSAIEDAADVLSSAAAASGRALRNAAEEVGPVVKRAQQRAVPVLEQLGEKGLDGFEKLMAAPNGVKLAVGAGFFLSVMIVSAAVAVALSGRDVDRETITVADEPATRVDDQPDPPELVDTPPVRKTVEVFPGVQDGPPPDGHLFAASHGVELRATADNDSEVLLWLEVGQILEEVRQVEDNTLVLVPPRGPAGFVERSSLTDVLPLEALARKIAFKGCQVRRSRSLDDCLFGAKQLHDGCLDKCDGLEHTRCQPTCDLAFEGCITSCRESSQRVERPRRRRRRRR